MFRDGPERLLVFQVGPERFALRLGDVHEVIDAPVVQPIPDSPASLLGIATIRGELVPIYDPRRALQLSGDVGGAVMLFDRGGRRVGLAIADVFDAIVVEHEEVMSAPGSEASDGILVGVVRRAGELVGVLDTDALLAAMTAAVEGEKA